MWERRNSNHIEVIEIEAYGRVHNVYDMQRFVQLIMTADSCVHTTTEKIKERKEKFEDAFKDLKTDRAN